MRVRHLTVPPLIVSTMIVVTVVAPSSSSSQTSSSSSQTKSCYPPEYTESGDLILPKNFHEWVFVGSPLTPMRLMAAKLGSQSFTMSTSNRVHTRPTRR